MYREEHIQGGSWTQVVAACQLHLRTRVQQQILTFQQNLDSSLSDSEELFLKAEATGLLPTSLLSSCPASRLPES